MNDWTPEDVERLASEVMGWTEVDPSRPGGPWKMPAGGGAWRPTWLPRDWNPFNDANADYEVLKKVRERWTAAYADEDGWQRQARFLSCVWKPWRERDRAEFAAGRLSPYIASAEQMRYEVGDYARAALAVLKGEQG